MATTSPRVRALLRQAKRTADSGKRAAAQQLYRQIVDEEPDTIEAWLGLAETSQDIAEREEALQRALALEPDNAIARSLLSDDGAAPGDAAAPSMGRDGADPYSQSRAWLDEATARAPETSTTKEQERQPDAKATQQSAGETAVDAPAATATDKAGHAPGADVLYCYRHPQRETGLRCITCNRPICTRCAKHTPVGYRCPQCIREAQDVFFSAGLLDYLLTAVVTLVLAVLAGLIAPRLGFFVIFIGPAAGTLIGRAAFRVARRRHGRYLPELVAVLVALGGLLPTAFPLIAALLLGAGSLGSIGFGLLWPLVYVFLATGAAYYQVK